MLDRNARAECLTAREVCGLVLLQAQERGLGTERRFSRRTAEELVRVLLYQQEPRIRPIRKRHLKFLERLMLHGNGARAAREVGYEGPHVRQIAWQLRRRLAGRYSLYLALQDR